jgi:predicted metal-dependent phosphoesterase TrpH/energy-coupling factor transporter ATP-binding protein EcfA2
MRAVESAYSPRGSPWHQWDLHVHTPSSFDYEGKNITDEQIVDCLIEAGIRAVAITDHHTIDVRRIAKLQELGAGKLTVFPGIELRDHHGGDPIHYVCIFPENCNLNHVWTTLQGKLELTEIGIKNKGGDDKVYVPIELGAKEARTLGGIVSIHAGAKSNSIEGISNKEQFQQRIKYDITKKYVDLMEIGQIKDIDRHCKIIFPATGLEKPLILCSDNHKVTEYSTKAPLWFRADPTFRGLLMVLREPRERVYIGDRPPELVRVEQNRTKHIKSVSFQRRASAPSSEQWFSGTIEFNPRLVAIVGNKGSGKSALSDMIGLLGATKNGDAFSFLSKNRFRHPSSGLAEHFDATIEWESGDTITKSLADEIKPEEVERLKYLPQDHVENVCNELASLGEEGFEQELKAVIFSHVPEAERLGNSSLDELVRFQTDEKQKRIDSLLKQLREISRTRANLEAQADPTVRKELTEKINRRKLELEAHDKAKPERVIDPSVDGKTPAPDAELIEKLKRAETSKADLIKEIDRQAGALRVAERRNAVAKRLIEKLDNFQKEFEVFKVSLSEDATELGLSPNELVSPTISCNKPETIRDSATKESKTAKDALDRSDPPGLRKQLETLEGQITELQAQLDAPYRAYQAHLKALSEWQTKRTAIEGSETDAESLKGLEQSLVALDDLPSKIDIMRDGQVSLALGIHAEKITQAEVYRNLYAAVQGFIDSHVLAKEKLKLEFRAELTCEDFAGRLLGALALNRKGSFMGVDEGRAKANEFVQATNWGDTDSVKAFLEGIDVALHTDQREGQGGPVQLKDQLLKGRKPNEVFETLYGLEYIRPRYILRWEGKDLSMLSPGERGTLLLVFYLLIDKSDLPLIIDQPEGNLDNHTVAKVLVECIKEACKRRQVFIVTHNPNLAVVCDADQVVHAEMDKTSNNTINYKTGSLENPNMSQYVTDVLEGTLWAFRVRDKKHSI